MSETEAVVGKTAPEKGVELNSTRPDLVPEAQVDSLIEKKLEAKRDSISSSMKIAVDHKRDHSPKRSRTFPEDLDKPLGAAAPRQADYRPCGDSRHSNSSSSRNRHGRDYAPHRDSRDRGHRRDASPERPRRSSHSNREPYRRSRTLVDFERADIPGRLRVRDLDFRDEPHLAQLSKQHHEDCAVVRQGELRRVLPDDENLAPRRPYRRIRHEDRSVLHWGQRKLMLSEIEFLTKFNTKNRVVVYAGAAPGTHIPYLANLFPDLSFHLIDPAPFHSNVVEKRCKNKKVEYSNAFFLSDTSPAEMKTKYPGAEFLFISDIRTGDPKVAEAEEVEEAVVSDMKLQMAGAIHLESVASMHKFRLPWGEGTSNYLNGDVYLPVWGPETTTETRLIAQGPPTFKDYDNRKYEEQMFYFNTVTRVAYYENRLVGRVPGMDHCFDCASECVVLLEFAKTIEGLSGEQALERAEAISKELNYQCSTQGGRTLESKVNAHQRIGWFEGRVYDPAGGSIQTRPNTHRRADQSGPETTYKPRNIEFTQPIKQTE